MILTDTICYSRLLWALQQPKFNQSVNKVTFTRPCVEFEGVAGYIETTVEIDVKNLKDFADIWHQWFVVGHDEKMKIRSTILNGTCHGAL